MVASEISLLQVINEASAGDVVENIPSLRSSLVMITDNAGKVIYNSHTGQQDAYALYPEIIDALRGNDMFTWRYQDGKMISKGAMPIVSYGATIGCVYITEIDNQQGAIIGSLQGNILFVSIALVVIIVAYSLFSSNTFSKRLRKIMQSMRIIRTGDYSHRVKLGGADELSLLGDEFNDLVERLQISENKRRQFVSDASHELKTPLASIKLLSDSILQNDMDPQTVKEFVSDIGNEAERLNRMSQKLLSLSHIEMDNSADCEITYIGPTMQKVARMLSAIAQQKDIKISVEILQDCSILIIEDDLYQILFNLAENGIKYNTTGGKLFLSLKREDDFAVLTVSDTGVGIPEDAKEHIFERFYRVDKARSRESGGSGLGLSIVKNMVLRNGGDISVDSILEEGTTFTVTFPVFDTEVAL